MAKQIRYLTVISLIITIFSCKEIKNEYYRTGELKKESFYINENCNNVKTYYKNGNIKSSGIICYGKKEGEWEEYDYNGKLVWKGNYVNSFRKYGDIIIDNLQCRIKFDQENNMLESNKEQLVQVSIPSIHPDDIIIGTTNSMSQVNEDSLNLDMNFKIIPNGKGDVKIYVFVDIEGQNIEVCYKILKVKGIW